MRSRRNWLSPSPCCSRNRPAAVPPLRRAAARRSRVGRWPASKTMWQGRSSVGFSSCAPVCALRSRSVWPNTTRPIPASRSPPSTSRRVVRPRCRACTPAAPRGSDFSPPMRPAASRHGPSGHGPRQCSHLPCSRRMLPSLSASTEPKGWSPPSLARWATAKDARNRALVIVSLWHFSLRRCGHHAPQDGRAKASVRLETPGASATSV